ncbi:MAG: phosphoribosylformylglycinamidine synthase subunit PurL [Candidatus Aenigmatarchaeota archaeon]|nr:MAG: phosphoribosylformylglycinamidine synthase II [Candidatus Aenigmarchaeota archaeon ex4484_14]RLI97651.1 MAG: phosphoribosylformylglycinamidine synthase subunit PurL [Candidatus Aenigmarchaeota archaeon]
MRKNCKNLRLRLAVLDLNNLVCGVVFVLYIKKDVPFDLHEINLRDATDEELKKISKETGVGLSLEEMQVIKDFFIKRGRNPTDVELQALGQSWSEHCSYKTSKPILKKFIFNIDAPQNILVIKEDAGVVEFDNDHAYVVALESHNHPSAVEPYGGAATGIGGILRDVVCMGAQPIALIDPLFFGRLDYEYKKLPKGVKHPLYLFSGVVSGIRDYGNRVGIPTTTGMIHFNNSYIGNCLVNVGCVGIVKKNEIIRSAVKNPDDVFILLGGKTGRDGIHGVTFASAELDESSESESRGAVQVGDPITKEPLIHVCLEANKKGLLTGMKDLGGGGLSCASGEMALAGGCGVKINLDKVPLKEKDMAPWEIWVSESQERMLVTARPENVDKIMELCKLWDVEANVIGHATKSKKAEVYYKGVKVVDMDIEFFVDSPVYHRKYVIEKKNIPETNVEEPKDYEKIILDLLSSLNIASKESVIRQYDHEVRASTVIKPMQGKIGSYTHGDAAVIKPLEESYRGIALSADVNPNFTEIDPFWGSASAVDEVCRNLASVGARPHSFADCLNFGNPEKPDRLGVFYESCRGLGYIAKSLGIPFVSGNVSFYNEYIEGPVAPTPTVLGVGIVKDIRKTCTTDLKKEGDLLYIIGETKKEMGGSEYYKLLNAQSPTVPKVNPENLKNSINAVCTAIEGNLVKSCHDISEGGLAVCVAEMMIGGDVGVEIDVGDMSDIRTDYKLFSESNTRWVVEIEEKKKEEFEKLMKRNSVKFFKLGVVSGRGLVIKNKGKKIVDIPIDKIKKVWNSGITKYTN